MSRDIGIEANLACPSHRFYSAVMKPRVNCVTCEWLYKLQHRETVHGSPRKVSVRLEFTEIDENSGDDVYFYIPLDIF